MFNKRLIFNSVLATGFIFLLIILFLKITQIEKLFGLFDPVGQALSDVDFTDLVFSELREIPPANEDIVLVNIGQLNRAQIAAQIGIINQYEPKVVGIDSFFKTLKPDSVGDQMLAEALSNVENLVMASQAVDYSPEDDTWNENLKSHPLFQYGETGLVNLYTDAQEQHQFKVNRTFPPYLDIDGERHLFFALKLVEYYDPEKLEKFLEFSDQQEEVINFTGNVNDFGQTKFGTRFFGLDVIDVFQENFTPDVIKDKIVIFGFLGESFDDRSWEDKFYTPMNKNFAGRSNPDMYGAVIHANITAMVLDENYINYQTQTSGVITAIIICFINVWIFSWIYWSLPSWYDGITKIIQLIELMFIVLINIFVFHWFNYKTELTLTAACIALAGDTLEVYYGLLTNVFTKEGRKEIFKIHPLLKKTRS